MKYCLYAVHISAILSVAAAFVPNQFPRQLPQFALRGAHGNHRECDVIRQRFHIPKGWSNKGEFVALSTHTFMEDRVASHALDFIHDSLRSTGTGYAENNDVMTQGFAENNDSMTHDYVHFMLMDLLEETGVPFVPASIILTVPSLLEYFDNKAPDLIIKSDQNSFSPLRPRPLILDVSIGRSEFAMNERLTRYQGKSNTFDFDAVGIADLTSKLSNRVLDPARVEYLCKQLQAFLVECAFWKASLEVSGLRAPPVLHLNPPSLEFHHAQDTFMDKMEEKAKCMNSWRLQA